MICVCASVCLCLYVCLSVCLPASVYVCVHVCMYVCVCVCVCIYTYIYTYTYIYIHEHTYICIYTYISSIVFKIDWIEVCMCICVYTHISLYTCICIYMYTWSIVFWKFVQIKAFVCICSRGGVCVCSCVSACVYVSMSVRVCEHKISLSCSKPCSGFSAWQRRGATTTRSSSQCSWCPSAAENSGANGWQETPSRCLMAVASREHFICTRAVCWQNIFQVSCKSFCVVN